MFEIDKISMKIKLSGLSSLKVINSYEASKFGMNQVLRFLSSEGIKI